MPRKEWKTKSYYCKRSKLTRSDFATLVFYYFVEVTLRYSRTVTYEHFISACKSSHEGFEYLSQQAFSRYFRRFGQHIWDKLVTICLPMTDLENVLDELLDLINGKTGEIDTSIPSDNSYSDDDLRRIKMFKMVTLSSKDKISRTLMFHLLSQRSKKVRGFKKDSFYLEFSRIFFIRFELFRMNYNPLSLYSINDREAIKLINIRVRRRFMSFLTHYPM